VSLVASSIILIASAPLTTICVANAADEAIGVMASQEMPDGLRTSMRPADVDIAKEVCLTVQWESNRPIRLQARRKSDHSDRSLLTPRCPDIGPGTNVHVVVGRAGSELTCALKGDG
jgi:hypothetical protein